MVGGKNGCVLADVLIEEYSDASNGKIEVCNFAGFLASYAHGLGIQKPIIGELIKMLRLERAVYKYIMSEADAIAQDIVETCFDDFCVMNEVYNQIGFDSIYGGNFEEAENVEVYDISIISCEVKYERELGVFEIKAQFEVEGNMDIEEYISREANYCGNVDFYISGWVTVSVAMIYSDLNCDPDEAYEIISKDIDYTKIEFDNEKEFVTYLKDV